MTDDRTAVALERIAAALERISPPPADAPDWSQATVWQWATEPDHLIPVTRVARVDMSLLVGIDDKRDTLMDNTQRFAGGLPANNALLSGARGTGKSSLVKAAHAVAARDASNLHLIEIHREDIPSIGRLMDMVRGLDQRFLIFCDDLSFEKDDAHYKSLKAVLDGGVAGRPENVLFYATSNRRHLMPRDMSENEERTAINQGEATEEKVSLSDRFGIWLGFYPCNQDDFLTMIRGYCDYHGIDISDDDLRAEAIEWSQTRGARSGRVAWQYVQDLAGRKGVALRLE